MPDQQRLIICFDGTWNRQDSSTNVLHHFNVIHKGPVADRERVIVQRKYYHLGVGTGVLDSMTGGGFGFGLETNVRDAYDWLVANHNDGDEIYVFGFSRGAYTARSLVGFIGRCGLLKRAAPITVTQLWEANCILGREAEYRTSIWDHLYFGKVRPKVRPITQLVRDSWIQHPPLAAIPDGVPGQLTDQLTDSEMLLIRHTRRVKITYLGVYDTVGALGWDALAIPGLSSKLALHHNMRPTTLIQHARHALAIDEHRSSFAHTPFLAYVGHDSGEAELERADAEAADAGSVKYWDRTLAMWARKIEQRWFVGAHSNIGGGYDNNRLARIPLRWILEGAIECGLECEPLPAPIPVTASMEQPRDSYEEFAAPLWTKILRNKRYYRCIDPDPQPNASPVKAKSDSAQPGFTLKTIHETIDGSVLDYWGNSGLPAPPNLYEYLQRRKVATNLTEPKHRWLGDKKFDYVVLVLWATLAAAGLSGLWGLIGANPRQATRLIATCGLAFVLCLVDWSESRVTFGWARGGGGAASRSFLDSIYWTRSAGFVLFFCGVIYSLIYLFRFGLAPDPVQATLDFVKLYWPVPFLAGVAVVIASLLDGASGKRAVAAFSSVILGPLACLAGVGAIAVAILVHLMFKVTVRPSTEPVDLSQAGLLLLLEGSFVYFWRALRWCSQPMDEANLDSITRLQRCFTPKQVGACLERWRQMLRNRWLVDDPVTGPAAKRMRLVVREALWRDIIGLIPVYTAVFAFGLWFAGTYFDVALFRALNHPYGPLTLALTIPLAAAVGDYLEDTCHLRYLSLHEKGRLPSALLTMFSWTMSTVKNLLVVVGLLGTMAAILGGAYQVLNAGSTGLRTVVAVLVCLLALILAAVIIVGRLVYLFAAPKEGGATGEHARKAAAGHT